MNLTEKTISSESIYNGKIINLKVDTVELPDGNTALRELVEHPGGVAVVAVDDFENVYLMLSSRCCFRKRCSLKASRLQEV